nr:MAG: putative RNA-dependent RNA polymerase [Mitoviridae sp.]
MGSLIIFYLWIFIKLFTVPLNPKGKRRLKTSPKGAELKPASIEELPRMISVLKSLLGLTTKESQILYEISGRMVSLIQKSGVKHTIAYYSEVLRLCFEYLSGRRMKNTKTWVKTWQSGLPKVIGSHTRDFIIVNRGKLISNHPGLLTDRGFLIFRAVISTVAIFRSLSPKHVLNFDSVTAPDTGTGTLSTKDIKGALRSLGITKLKVGSPYFFWSNKAGVNAQYAFISIGLDFLGLIGHPKVYFSHITYSLRMGYVMYLIVFLLMTLWSLPLFLLSYPILGVLPLGRLSIVKELRGKARVVGITDYWTQILFRPLHDSIYSALGKVPYDGIRNQLRPIEELLSVHPSHVVSVDLTAATDRLPVKLQADILEALGLPGGPWMDILDRIYFYQDKPYKYAVGQPMGAYSSFAMLDLTNHVLMHCAANRLKLEVSAGQYAILGDDVAINGQALADPYTKILTMLGVEVNPIKGFSGSVLEFAKQIFTIGGLNLSPIGAKSLLRASRDPIFLPTLVTDMSKKDYYLILVPELPMFTNYLSKTFLKEGRAAVKWLFCFLGPQSGLWQRPEGYVANKVHQILFESMLSSCGVQASRINVQKYFEKLIMQRARFPLRAIISSGDSSLRVFEYTIKPLIWSREKFETLKLQTPENTATLAMASGSVILFPVLLWYWLKASLTGFFLYLISKALGRAKADPLYLEAFKHPLQYLRMKWDLLKYAEFNLIKAWNTPVGRTLYQGITSRKVDIHRTILMFQGWYSRVKLSKPMQLLNLRFTKIRPGELEEDILPAVRTAERCLSSIDPAFGKYYSSVRRDLKRKLIKKTKDSKKVRGRPSKTALL